MHVKPEVYHALTNTSCKHPLLLAGSSSARAMSRPASSASRRTHSPRGGWLTAAGCCPCWETLPLICSQVGCGGWRRLYREGGTFSAMPPLDPVASSRHLAGSGAHGAAFGQLLHSPLCPRHRRGVAESPVTLMSEDVSELASAAGLVTWNGPGGAFPGDVYQQWGVADWLLFAQAAPFVSEASAPRQGGGGMPHIPLSEPPACKAGAGNTRPPPSPTHTRRLTFHASFRQTV